MNRSYVLTLIPTVILTTLVLCTYTSHAEGAYNENICGTMINNGGIYVKGPYDYRKTTQANKDLVEFAHFNKPKKMLGNFKERNRNKLNIWREFEYTLNIFPNSPRALAAIDRLSLLIGRDKPPGARFSAECAFLAAERFTLDDPIVRVLHGLYLVRRGRATEAEVQLEEANKLAPDNPSIQYNLGLAYFQIKDYVHAREHASVAYDMGYPLPGLREMLKRVGYWEVNSGPGKSLPPVSAVSPQESTPRAEPVTPSTPGEASPALER